MRKHMTTMLLSISIAMVGCDQSPSPSNTTASESAEPTVAARGTSDNFIPLVAVGYADARYGGARRYFYMDETNLTNQGFNDVISSIKVYKGPNYDQYKATYGVEPSVAFCTEERGNGCIRYTAGFYPTVSRNDWYSSVVFNLEPQLAETATPGYVPPEVFPVYMILRMFKDTDFRGRYMDVLVTTNEEHKGLANYKDHGMNDVISSIQLMKGPNWSKDHGLRLYADKDYRGASIMAYCGASYCTSPTDLNGWSDRISSSQYTWTMF